MFSSSKWHICYARYRPMSLYGEVFQGKWNTVPRHVCGSNTWGRARECKVRASCKCLIQSGIFLSIKNDGSLAADEFLFMRWGEWFIEIWKYVCGVALFSNGLSFHNFWHFMGKVMNHPNLGTWSAKASRKYQIIWSHGCIKYPIVFPYIPPRKIDGF